MAVRAEVITVAIVFVANLQGAVGPLDLPWSTALSWGVAALQKSEAGNALSQAMTNIKEMPNQLYTGTQQVMSTLDAAANALLGDCDGPGLVEIIKPKLKLKSVPKSKCLRGVKFASKEVTTMEGSLHINKDAMKIEANTAEGEEEGTSQTIFISFTFPNLFFTYKFVSKPKFRLAREGRVRFVLNGPNSLTLRVRVPKALDDVKTEAKKGTCFVRVREVTFQLGKIIEVDELWYNSLLQNTSKKGLTQGDMDDLVKVQTVRNTYIDLIKISLKKALEPIIKDDKIFCDSKKVTIAEAPKCAIADILNVNGDS